VCIWRRRISHIAHMNVSCRSTLQPTATHCNTLQHTATRCNTLQHAATRCNTLLQDVNAYLAHEDEGSFETSVRISAADVVALLGQTFGTQVCCSVLQCVAVCCSVLQRVGVAMCFCGRCCCATGSDLWHTGLLQCLAVCCSVLQCVAVCCSVLQCVAVCCSVLQCLAVCCRVLQCVSVAGVVAISFTGLFCKRDL